MHTDYTNPTYSVKRNSARMLDSNISGTILKGMIGQCLTLEKTT